MYTFEQQQQRFQDTLAKENLVFSPEELYHPIDYTMRLGGKQLRPTLLLLSYQLFGGDDDRAMDGAMAIEMFHNFTLLHDDIMDKSPLRRGKPTVYLKYGSNAAILSGDTMFAMAWSYLLKGDFSRQKEILQVFNRTAIEVCEGQQHDINFESMEEVSMSQYMNMIRLKTAVLLACSLKMGALMTTASEQEVEEIYQFGIEMGLAFQLQDDLLDAYGDTATFGKTLYQDIRDHKKTALPILACSLLEESQKSVFKDVYNKNSGSNEEIEAVLTTYKQQNIPALIEQNIAMHIDNARQHLGKIAVEEARKEPLYMLLKKLVGRKK